MGKITTPRHTIVFGGITMIERGANPPDESGCIYIVQGQDTTFGNPVPVTQALLTLMRVGSTVAYDRTDNREPVLRVTLRADDSDTLALGEKALQLECEKPNTLTWIPPDDTGEPSVFDIVWSSLELVMDDQAELRRERTYLIHLQALPHARPEDLVVTPALPTGAPTLTVVDDGSSTTGWTAYRKTSTSGGYEATTVGTAGGQVFVSEAATQHGLRLRRAGAIAMAGDAFLVVDWTTTIYSGSPPTPSLLVDDAPALIVADVALPSGLRRTYFRVLTAPASSIAFQIEGDFLNNLFVDAVNRTPTVGGSGTTRQKALSLVPGGSVRTQGNVLVSHATSALGTAIVYTSPSGTGYLPPLRPWLVSSASVTPDVATVSGARQSLATTPSRYDIPAPVVPAGDYQLWARLRLTSGGPTTVGIFVDGQSIVGSTAFDGDHQQVSVALPASAAWVVVPLARLTLPSRQMGTAGKVSISLLRATSDPVEIDEAWLFAMDQGRLTVVDCGSAAAAVGGPSNRLWIDAPSLGQPQGGIWRGNAADRSDAWHAGPAAQCWSDHDFDPQGTNVFVVTDNALDATTSLEHYKRFHTHVARET